MRSPALLGLPISPYNLSFFLDCFHMRGGVTRLDGLPGQPSRVTRLVGVSFLHALSSAEVQEFVLSIRCAKCTVGAKSNGSITRRTSARCVSISRTSLSFSRTSMDFSTLAKFDSLKLTETHG